MIVSGAEPVMIRSMVARATIHLSTSPAKAPIPFLTSKPVTCSLFSSLTAKRAARSPLLLSRAATLHFPLTVAAQLSSTVFPRVIPSTSTEIVTKSVVLNSFKNSIWKKIQQTEPRRFAGAFFVIENRYQLCRAMLIFTNFRQFK